MNKEFYIQHLTDNINNNIDRYFPYIDSRDLYSFCSLKTLINENINCLLLNNYIASICVTNHILERFVKLSIIEHGTTGLNYSDDNLYNIKLLESYDFDNEILNNTLAKLKNINLISDVEYKCLKDFKNNYRNPYSHSETKKIIKNTANFFSGRMYSINDILNNNGLENIPYEEKTISTLSPAIAQLHIQDHAIDNAFNYFKEVFDIIVIVDKRLQDINSNK
ncbi:hypothetical protein [Myroides fluvii]|uniref:hypothetical protein n=1 Tax=Myroides fluvii TaxID=2572594 RepID=UPI00131D1296|nr:hypothetical protein [Myroides fluvii]